AHRLVDHVADVADDGNDHGPGGLAGGEDDAARDGGVVDGGPGGPVSGGVRHRCREGGRAVECQGEGEGAGGVAFRGRDVGHAEGPLVVVDDGGHPDRLGDG